MNPSVLSRSPLSTSDAALGHEYFAQVQSEVDRFVAQHFEWCGTLRLHRHALSFDILRAPVNVVLSPALVLTRLLATICALLRFQRAARWLRGHRIVLRTQVAARVEAAVVTDLLGIALPEGAPSPDSAELSRIILAAPQFRRAFRAKADIDAATASATGIAVAIAEYSSARSAVADITNALLALAIGGLMFQALTPGMISMAPRLAQAQALENAVTNFPLGQTAGAMWYGVFSASASPAALAMTVAVLLLVGSVVGAFAGVVADPVQARLGIHRRRLLRFLDAVEDDLLAAGTRQYMAREHLYARFMDIWDAAASALRIFRS
jgi:hypothetical protein